jgi:ABC-type branched-subunit amino acid transport system substrate-binding protein
MVPPLVPPMVPPMVPPTPWALLFGQAKPVKIVSMQPLSGAAAADRKRALVGIKMAAHRINAKSDGRKAEQRVRDDKIDLPVGAPTTA